MEGFVAKTPAVRPVVELLNSFLTHTFGSIALKQNLLLCEVKIFLLIFIKHLLQFRNRWVLRIKH